MGDKITGDAKLNLKASDIARFLNGEFHGVDIQIKTVEPINDITENALVFSKEKIQKHLLEKLQDVCIVTSALPDEGTGRNAFILVKNPRLAFAKALSEFFVERKTPGIGQYTVIHPTARIGLSVIIGNGCTIGRDVEIGDYTEIRHNVVIADGVKIGKHCLIRSNAVLGEEGFGFEYEEDGTPIRIPHLGGVRIEDYVEIGNFTTIARGTLKETVIHSHVKIDNLVHIAHNCIIGENSMIIACAEISGSTVVGRNSWLGPGCATKQKITIGDDCFIGAGSVVLEDVPPGVVMIGNPARFLRNRS